MAPCYLKGIISNTAYKELITLLEEYLTKICSTECDFKDSLDKTNSEFTTLPMEISYCKPCLSTKII